ncbi:MAG: SelB C-terminal domain-containing protein [Actinobacteria bacterium]|nr:SelB C-terminal domain-containing protein [Actinomycetota bacterium]
MHVVATAGHVDHGKSTLVRAVTGMEPDRWAQERERGMTIDLGYAWTSLPSGAVLGFVDVPGHSRFIGNMLAGLGPSPSVLFVVAADEGWRQQSTEHLAAVDALGLTSGLLAVTRSDLADPGPATAQALALLEKSSLGRVGVERSEIGRGDALLTPGAWRAAGVLDVRVTEPDLPGQLVLHVGSAAVAVRVRPLGDDVVRLQLGRPLPLQAGDRALLRDPGAQAVVAGVVVLDADPPELRRRGAAGARAAQLAPGVPDLAQEVARRGAARAADLSALGLAVGAAEGVRVLGEWLVADPQWERWVQELVAAVDGHADAAPLEVGLPDEAARRRVGLPDRALLAPLAAEAGLEHVAGRLRRPGAVPRLGPGVTALEERLAAAPFDAPEQPDLDALGLTRQEVAAAVAAGRLVQLPDGVLLLPDGPARAMRLLAALPQPFTASTARQALGTTRRVAIPLLEHLDGRGWTRRVDGSLREVVR